jgi:hypothetical protein
MADGPIGLPDRPLFQLTPSRSITKQGHNPQPREWSIGPWSRSSVAIDEGLFAVSSSLEVSSLIFKLNGAPIRHHCLPLPIGNHVDDSHREEAHQANADNDQSDGERHFVSRRVFRLEDLSSNDSSDIAVAKDPHHDASSSWVRSIVRKPCSNQRTGCRSTNYCDMQETISKLVVGLIGADEYDEPNNGREFGETDEKRSLAETIRQVQQDVYADRPAVEVSTMVSREIEREAYTINGGTLIKFALTPWYPIPWTMRGRKIPNP